MKAVIKTIEELIDTFDILQVPIYQRYYSWNKKHWNQVWIDLINCVENDKKRYFFGNIILQKSDDRTFIIDGQQRLITISLLIRALSLFKENDTDINNEENQYLLKFVEKIRNNLVLNTNDEEVFKHIIKYNEAYSSDNKKSKIEECYEFFLKKIKKQNQLAKFIPSQKLFEKLIDFTLSIVYVTTNDEPQQVFERLNATSLKLTEADLIRNYVLMNLNPLKQEEFYEKYWSKIEKLVDNLENFIRHFTMAEFKKSFPVNKITIYFKELFKDIFENNEKREKMGRRLLRSAYFYSYIIQKRQHKNKKVNRMLKRLKKTKLTTYYPYLLSVFDTITNIGDLLKILRIIESLCFRRICTKRKSSVLTPLFAGLNRRIETEIKKNLETESDLTEVEEKKEISKQYVDVLIAILTDKKTNLFPTNDEFRKALIKTNLRKDKKMRLELFKFIINFREPGSLRDRELNIKYIMPEKLTSKWKKHLGDNWEDVHDRCLDRLGNLTVTDKKLSLSDKTIGNKIPLSFINTELIIHSRFENINVWNENEIEKNGRFLANILIKVWPYWNTDYNLNLSWSRYD